MAARESKRMRFTYQGQEYVVEFLEVTPGKAAEMLLASTPQSRDLRESNIERLHDDMKRNAFEFTGIPLAFDENGYLIDGHHRLEAQVLAGETLGYLVVRGIKTKAVDKFDIGAGRTVAEILRITGRTLPQQSIVVTVAGLLMHGDKEYVSQVTNRPLVADRAWAQVEEILPWAQWAKSTYSAAAGFNISTNHAYGVRGGKKAVTAGALATLGLLMQRQGADPVQVKSFLEAVVGRGWCDEQGLPARNRAIRHLTEVRPMIRVGGGSSVQYLFRVFDDMIRLYNAWIAAGPLPILKPRTTGIRYFDELTVAHGCREVA